MINKMGKKGNLIMADRGDMRGNFLKKCFSREGGNLLKRDFKRQKRELSGKIGNNEILLRFVKRQMFWRIAIQGRIKVFYFFFLPLVDLSNFTRRTIIVHHAKKKKFWE